VVSAELILDERWPCRHRFALASYCMGVYLESTDANMLL